VASGTTSTLVALMGWEPAFVSLYMGVSGLLTACTIAYWLLDRPARGRRDACVKA
jgi:hypothetical protein